MLRERRGRGAEQDIGIEKRARVSEWLRGIVKRGSV